MYKVVLYGISDNMASLEQLSEYGATNAVDPNTMGYYVINYLSETYKLQEDQIKYGQVSKSDKLVVKYEYLSLMKSKTHWYWKQNRTN